MTASVLPRQRSLFVSLNCPTYALSENALSFFFYVVIMDSGGVIDGSSSAHSI